MDALDRFIKKVGMDNPETARRLSRADAGPLHGGARVERPSVLAHSAPKEDTVTEAVSPEDWIPERPMDSADYLDRPLPLYDTKENEEVKLPPFEETEQAMADHIEGTHFVDADGNFIHPSKPPEIEGWGEDGEDESDRLDST